MVQTGNDAAWPSALAAQSPRQMGMKMSVALEPVTMPVSVQFRSTIPGATDMAIVPVYVGLDYHNN